MILPLELRQQIYHYYFLNAVVTINFEQLHGCTKTLKKDKTLPALMSVNESVRDEAILPMISGSTVELARMAFKVVDIGRMQKIINDKKLNFSLVHNIRSACISLPDGVRFSMTKATEVITMCNQIRTLRFEACDNDGVPMWTWSALTKGLMDGIVKIRWLESVTVPPFFSLTFHHDGLCASQLKKQVREALAAAGRDDVLVKGDRSVPPFPGASSYFWDDGNAA